MKKAIVSALLVCMVLSLLCVPAGAAQQKSGFAGVGSNVDGVSLIPLKADGTAAELVNGLYVDAAKMSVTYSGAVSGSFYLVLALSSEGVPTESNIQYIDQNTAAVGGVSFVIYPKDLESGMTYYVYLSSNADADISALTPVASFTYVSYRPGDVDGNGSISSNDAVMVMNYLAENIDLSAEQLLAADVDNTVGVSVTDALYILQAIAHLKTLG